MDVAVDYARLTGGLAGEVNQAYFGDGVATRMIVPRCPALDLGRGRGFSIEGWINPTASAAVYDARASFRTNTNPNGVWKYGWSTGLNGALTLFRRASKPPVNNGLELMWDDPANSRGWAPSVAVNSGGDFNDGNVTFKAGALIMAVGTTGNSYAHVVWTAPQGGQYLLKSLFIAQQNRINVDVHVLVNGASIYDSSITQNGVSRAFSQTFTLARGDTVDFALGPNGDMSIHAGNTGLEASLTPLAIAMPIAEWNDPTNSAPQGVQFWLNGLATTNVPGALFANIWDTNLQPHVVTTVTNAITNGGWQHVALTFDTNSLSGVLYTNGQQAARVQFPVGFVPRTFGDLYLGYHPPGLPNGACYAGGLDEFSLYQRALSPCEVQAIFNAGSRGKYGTNVLVCPVATEVTLLTASGAQTYGFTNGLTWTNNGPQWETNTINFSTATNPTAIVVRGAGSLQSGGYQRAQQPQCAGG